MAATVKEGVLQAFEIVKEEEVVAPIEIVFETILEQMGPLNSTPEKPMPMVLEAWPGGRWYRDLGNNTGHFWGTVQTMKTPSLLEIWGPLFMSSPAISNLQYRLTEEDGATRMRFVHRAIGWIGEQDRAVDGGWTQLIRSYQRGSRKAGRKVAMCPFCVGTATWIVASVVSASGASGLAAAKLWKSKANKREQGEAMTSNEQISKMKKPPVVSAEEWQKSWQEMLVKEKAHTRSRDSLAAARRRMPWLAAEKEYVFEGPQGKVSLLDLFEGRRQLVLYRAFYDEGVYGWPDHACVGCSLGADQVSHLSHLHARDTTLAYASRGSQENLAHLKQRMGWEKIPWYTITDHFDKDFGVDEWHGHNVFFRDENNKIFRTYFINNRGDEAMGNVWSYLDVTPLGRQEDWEDSPQAYPQTLRYKWWRWHDVYGNMDSKWDNVVDDAMVTLKL